MPALSSQGIMINGRWNMLYKMSWEQSSPLVAWSFFGSVKICKCSLSHTFSHMWTCTHTQWKKMLGKLTTALKGCSVVCRRWGKLALCSPNSGTGCQELSKLELYTHDLAEELKLFLVFCFEIDENKRFESLYAACLEIHCFPQALEKASWFACGEELSHLNISSKV